MYSILSSYHIPHTGSVLSTNPPRLRISESNISSLNHSCVQYTHHHLIWHVFPLYSSSFLAYPLSVYTPCIYTIRFDLQLIERRRRRCAALLMLRILSGAPTQNTIYLLTFYRQYLRPTCIPTVDRPDVYTEQVAVHYQCIIHPSHRIPHGQRFCNGCLVCVGNGIGEY